MTSWSLRLSSDSGLWALGAELFLPLCSFLFSYHFPCPFPCPNLRSYRSRFVGCFFNIYSSHFNHYTCPILLLPATLSRPFSFFLPLPLPLPLPFFLPLPNQTISFILICLLHPLLLFAPPEILADCSLSYSLLYITPFARSISSLLH